jgi:hypothetical protein
MPHSFLVHDLKAVRLLQGEDLPCSKRWATGRALLVRLLGFCRKLLQEAPTRQNSNAGTGQRLQDFPSPSRIFIPANEDTRSTI